MWIVYVMAGATVVLVALGLMRRRGTEMNLSIEPETLKNELGGGSAPMLLDVRSPQEFSGGHIPGAKNVTCDEIIAHGLEASNDADIVVYCHSGFRSANAQRILRSKGFTRIRNLKGGIVAWKGPVEK